jgi:hypothetical protein
MHRRFASKTSLRYSTSVDIFIAILNANVVLGEIVRGP